MNPQAVESDHEWQPSDDATSEVLLPGSFPSPKHPRVAALQPSTPVVMKTASIDGASHIRSFINPFVKQDVAGYTISVSLSTWLEAVTGISYAQIRDWSLNMVVDEWFADPIVSNALGRFCNATQEAARYDPFSEIANHVIEKARRTLDGVPKDYPVADIKFYRNDPIYLQCYEKHGALGARRKPDVLCIREGVSRNIKRGTGKSPPGAEWPSVLLFGEFKFDKRADLNKVLDSAKTRRKLLSAAMFNKGSERMAASGNVSDSDITKTMESLTATTSTHRSRQPGATSQAEGRKRLRDEMDEESARVSSKKPKSEPENAHPETEVAVQTASYALEVLSCTNGTRIYSLGLMFKDDKVTLWYYDASGLVKTTDILSIITNFEEFSAALVALACCDASRWGALPVLRPPEEKPYPQSFPPTDLTGYTVDLRYPGGSEPKVKITLGKPVFCQYALVGRRTFVYEATSPHDSLKNDIFVVKFSQQIKTRRSEPDLLRIAVAAGVTNLPTFYFANDLWSLSDGPRSIFHTDPKPYDDRVLRVIVCQKYVPLHVVLLEHPEYLETMIAQLLQCIHDLRYKARMLHRDISVNNIMCDLRGNEPLFILNDFDLATTVSEDGFPLGPTSKHRTGTLPYMSYEIIKDMSFSRPKGIYHRLRHEFESLFWSSLWCTARIEPVKDTTLRGEIEECTLKWETGDLHAIASYKETFLNTTQRLEEFPMTPKFEIHRAMLDRWMSIFSRANGVRSLYNADLRIGMPGDQSTLDVQLDETINLITIAQALRLPGLRPVIRPGFFDNPCFHQ